jgi:hypothetical protein
MVPAVIVPAGPVLRRHREDVVEELEDAPPERWPPVLRHAAIFGLARRAVNPGGSKR